MYNQIDDDLTVSGQEIPVEDAAFYLSKEGPFAHSSTNYEERPCQIELVKKIMQSFNESKIGVFEAGTGVGKSFAYLIPSILWAVKNKERVVISTGTINLQHQIFEKDIPLAQKITGKKVKSILLKGRQNYLCLRKLADAEAEKDLFTEDSEVFDTIYEWSKNTKEGCKNELDFVPSDRVWSKVNSESDGCMGGRCPYHDECFVQKVRKEANEANIVVVNHHLLFADIESRMNGAGYEDAAVLPAYKRLVLDEAHGIEDSATSFFSESFTRFSLMKQINLLFRAYHGSYSGFLVQSSAVSAAGDFSQKALEAVESIKDALLFLDQTALLALDEEMTLRIHEKNESMLCDVFDGFSRLKTALCLFTDVAGEVLDQIDEKDQDLPSVWECKTVLNRIVGFAALCTKFCTWSEHCEDVFWFQKIKIPPKIPGEDFLVFMQFVETPLDIAPMMNKGVFEPLETVICTSATLRTENNFGYWMRRTGASFTDPERLLTADFDSPFPYRQNVLFAVPNDAPFPNSPYFQSYVEETLPRLISASGGRTLVLFTSYESLKYAYSSSRTILAEKGINLFKQGDDDRFRLLERFKEDTTSVLFATDSFWEGVDVPGSSLTQVIIVKLPFAVPNDPVFAARSEAIEKKGGSSFMQLSVPQAVIKFRQGFGRLIRRGDDKGVIVVLDRRIVENKYGKMFTKSVPMTRRMNNSLSYILDAIEKFI